MIFRKLKAATTLATLLAVLFVGAILITPSPVQAGGCSEKKKTKSCDKSQDKEQKKDQEKDQEKEKEKEKSGCSKK